jgi:hypothetical protein
MPSCRESEVWCSYESPRQSSPGRTTRNACRNLSKFLASQLIDNTLAAGGSGTASNQRLSAFTAPQVHLLYLELLRCICREMHASVLGVTSIIGFQLDLSTHLEMR